jgi:hypothetical protein
MTLRLQWLVTIWVWYESVKRWRWTAPVSTFFNEFYMEIDWHIEKSVCIASSIILGYFSHLTMLSVSIQRRSSRFIGAVKILCTINCTASRWGTALLHIRGCPCRRQMETKGTALLNDVSDVSFTASWTSGRSHINGANTVTSSLSAVALRAHQQPTLPSWTIIMSYLMKDIVSYSPPSVPIIFALWKLSRWTVSVDSFKPADVLIRSRCLGHNEPRVVASESGRWTASL